MLRKIFGPKKDEVSFFFFFCKSPGTVRTLKSRRVQCAEHAVRLGETRNVYKIGRETSWKMVIWRTEKKVGG